MSTKPVSIFHEVGVTTKVMTLHPKTASIMLERNTINRNVRRRHVDYFIGLIQRGEWKLTHQGIAVADTGEILDGQHRLIAIAESGHAVPIMITRGLDKSVFEAIDANAAPRSMTDLTKIPRSEVEIARYALTLSGTLKPSPDQIRAAHASFSDYVQAIESVSKNRVRVITSTPVRYAAILRFAILPAAESQYVLDLYHALVAQRFGDLPPIGVAFMRKVINGDIVVAGGRRALPLVNAWIMFDPKKRDHARITVGDDGEQKAMAEIQAWTTSILGNQQAG